MIFFSWHPLPGGVQILCTANCHNLTLASPASISSVCLFSQAFCFSHIEVEPSDPPCLFTYTSHCLEFSTATAHHIHGVPAWLLFFSASLWFHKLKDLFWVTSSKTLPSSACPAPHGGIELNTASYWHYSNLKANGKMFCNHLFLWRTLLLE